MHDTNLTLLGEFEITVLDKDNHVKQVVREHNRVVNSGLELIASLLVGPEYELENTDETGNFYIPRPIYCAIGSSMVVNKEYDEENPTEGGKGVEPDDTKLSNELIRKPFDKVKPYWIGNSSQSIQGDVASGQIIHREYVPGPSTSLVNGSPVQSSDFPSAYEFSSEGTEGENGNVMNARTQVLRRRAVIEFTTTFLPGEPALKRCHICEVGLFNTDGTTIRNGVRYGHSPFTENRSEAGSGLVRDTMFNRCVFNRINKYEDDTLIVKYTLTVASNPSPYDIGWKNVLTPADEYDPDAPDSSITNPDIGTNNP